MKKSYRKKAKIAVFGFFVAAIAIFSDLKISSAQQDPPQNAGSGMVLANVNMRDARIEKQEKNDLTISFNISNDFDKIQPGILIRASLQKKENDSLTVVDEKIIGSEFTLDPKEKSRREITYVIPDFIQGKYEIWLNTQTAGGFPLSTARVGETTFSGTNDYVEIINSSCFLKVKEESEDKKYTLLQGVDIEKNENLQAVCDLMNHSDQQKKFSAQFQTFQRNTFGTLLETSQKNDASFALQAKEKKQFIFDLPKAKDPQAYDIKLTLHENKKTISNSSVFHYVLRGASATIQSLQMDKVSYSKGETAKASLIITGSADSFPGSRRGTGTDLKGASLSVKIQSSQTLCGQIQKNPRMDGMSDSIEIAMAENCPEPTASVILKDSAGNILAQKDIFIGKNSRAEMEKAIQSKKGRNLLGSISAIIIFLLVVLIGTYAFWKIKRKSSIIVPIFILGAGFIFFLNEARPAKALTLGWMIDVDYSIYAEGTIDKSSYYPGEAIVVWGRTAIQYPTCSNGSGFPTPYTFFAEVNGTTHNLAALESVTSMGNVQSAPGDYVATFTLKAMYPDWQSDLSGTIPYTVIHSPLNGVCGYANGTAGCSPPPAESHCSSGSPSGVSDIGYWSWTCAGDYGGSTANCSATKSVINASCGWAIGDITNPFPPTDGFCDQGHIVGGVTDDGNSWSWTCTSDCNGVPAFCNKPKPIIDGECRNGQTFCPGSSLSNADLCTKGYPNIHTAPSAFSSSFSWQCKGYNGGSDTDIDACTASTYSDVKTSTPPNVCQGSSIATSIIGNPSSFCYDGNAPYATFVTLDSSSKFQWRCTDSCGTQKTSPEYDKKAPTTGQCGTADGKNLCNGLGSLTWCDKGVPNPDSPPLDGYNFSWQCVDPNSCGGIPDTCSAGGRKSCGWNETNP